MSPDLYFSFFMFTADLRPGDREYAATVVRHMQELLDRGYAGFDLPVAPIATEDFGPELERYRALRGALEDAGLGEVGITTNVMATRTFDPSSPYGEQRQAALRYLRSRVDITAALGGSTMAGPVVMPYSVFPTGDFGEPVWSDALQDWATPRYAAARPVLQELGEYAEAHDVKVAIEPVDHWETPAPNMVSEVADFLDGVPSRQVGVCIDSAHVLLGSDGPEAYAEAAGRLGADGRIHAVHVSPPDRGAFRDSWIPYEAFLEPILPHFDGPFLVETFNAVPPFVGGLRLGRRRFWRPGEDEPVPGVPDAYTVAGEALEAVRRQLEKATA